MRETFPRTSHIRQGLLTAILAGMLASGAASSPSSPPRIRIISPEPGAIVVGETPILVKVVPGDHPVIRVEIRVNGELLAALVHPQYRLTWDAGFDLTQHRIEARANPMRQDLEPQGLSRGDWDSKDVDLIGLVDASVDSQRWAGQRTFAALDPLRIPADNDLR